MLIGRMDEAVSKASVCEILADIYPTDGEKIVAVKEIDKAYEAIQRLPSAQPESRREWYMKGYRDAQDAALHESCTDCPLYDHDRHRCPRFNKVIPTTIQEIMDTQPRMRGKWIEVNDAYNRISGRCSACGWEAHMYEDDVVGMPFCPSCGADMRQRGERE